MLRTLLLFLLALLLSFTPIAAAATPKNGAAATDRADFLLSPPGVGVAVAPPAVSAASYAVFDPVSGLFLAERDGDTRRPMASTTKIMTALVVLEHTSPEDTVTVPPTAVGIEGSSVYLFAGERLSVRTLLYALMLASANDAATALAIHVAGSVEAFADLMNARATELGLTDTHFCNPHGLHDEAHYTTAKDLARLTAAALANRLFAEIVSAKRYAVPENGETGRLFLNHNKLLRQLEGCIGVKTGFTKKSGRCLVSATRREGLTLVTVTLNAPSDWQDHKNLAEWGFGQYKAFVASPTPFSLPVVGGIAGEVTLLPEKSIPFTLPADHPAITCTVEAPRFLYADIKAGDVLGKAVYRMGEAELCRIPLVAGEDVPPLPRPTVWEKLKNLFRKEKTV